MINPKYSTLQKYVERLNPSQRYLIGEFIDNYEDGVMDRRDLLERVYRITGSVAAAAGTLLALGCAPAASERAVPSPTAAPAPTTAPATAAGAGAQPAAAGGSRSPLSVAANDSAVRGGPVTFPNPTDGATIMAYLAQPATGAAGAGAGAASRFPAVMICHENRGIGPHYEDVARRFAKAGYVGISLDLLSRQGGTAAVPADQVGAAISGAGAAERFVEDFRAAMAYLRAQPFVDGGRIAMTGYCFGGSVTLNLAAKEPTLRAAIPYYGTPSFPDELKNAKAAVLGVYAENDARVNASIPVVEAGLQRRTAVERHVPERDAPKQGGEGKERVHRGEAERGQRGAAELQPQVAPPRPAEAREVPLEGVQIALEKVIPQPEDAQLRGGHFGRDHVYEVAHVARFDDVPAGDAVVLVLARELHVEVG